MKKSFLLSLCFLFICTLQCAAQNAVTVGDNTGFIQQYNGNIATNLTINLNGNIDFSNANSLYTIADTGSVLPVNSSARGMRAIVGANHYLDGNNIANLGFSVNVANYNNDQHFIRYLSFQDVTVKNFANSAVTLTEGVFYSTNVVYEGNQGSAIKTSTNNNFKRLNFYSSNTFINNSSSLGGALFLYGNDTIANFYGTVLFSSNSVLATPIALGGAIYVNSNAKINFNTTEATFSTNKSSSSGGAMYVVNDAEVNFTGNSIMFLSNLASTNGGAIYLENRANISFAIGAVVNANNNKALNGGFMYANGQTMSIYSLKLSTNIADDSGGGIYAAQGSNISFLGNNTEFNYNVAESSGGALYLASGARASFDGLQAKENKAFNGGVIYGVQNSNLSFANGAYNFSVNIATNNGGAIYLENRANISFASVAVVNANNNKALNGGFMYANGQTTSIYNLKLSTNIADGSGGGIYAAQGSNISFLGNNTEFNYNVAGSSGGALYLDSGARASFNDLQAKENKAFNGGVIYGVQNSNLSFANGAYNFSVNIATNNGGAIYLENRANISFTNGAVVNANNNKALNGGFMYANGQSMSIYNLKLSTNTAYDSGGGIYAAQGSDISFLGNNTEFNYNVVESSGGALYLDSGARASFDGLQATGNKALSGGVIYGAQSSSINLESGTYKFDVNIATNNGGAVYLENGVFTSFSQDASITANGNEALNGGFMYTNGQNITFNDINISGNKALNDGGGIYAAQNSNLNFIGGNTRFNYNTAGNKGGALYLANSTASFNSNLQATGNRALSGGAIYASQGSALTFFNSVFIFNVNVATNNGGAIYFEKNASADFSYANINASYNSASNGGFAYFNGQTTSFGNINLSSNSAKNNGGAIYAGEAAGLIFSGLNNTVFEHNTASKSGGAVYISGGSSAEFSNSEFLNNEAGENGGAVFVEGYQNGNSVYVSTVNFKSNFNQRTVFRGNKAKGVNNALYLGNNSRALFLADYGASIEMHDSIAGSSVNAKILFSGQGDFNLYSDSLYNNSDIEISAGGGSFNLRNGANLNAGYFINNQGSVINMQDGKKNTLTVKNLANYGDLYMDIFSSEKNDQIIVGGNLILNSTTSVLHVDIDSADTNFRKKIYKLVYYGGTLNGEFNENINLTGISLEKNPLLNYGDIFERWITLTLRGDNAESEFRGVTFNQKQTANTYNLLSLRAEDDLDVIIALIEGMDGNSQNKALSEAAGYFLANVIRSGGADGGSNEIYDRIKDNGGYKLTNNGLWGQTKINRVSNKSDDNSLGDYTDMSMGAMIGYDRFMAENNFMFGIYGKINKHSINQDPDNTADVMNTGLGVYGGYIINQWEVKGMLSGSADSYSTERYIPFAERKAKADFNGTTLGADIEGAWKTNLTEDVKLRPYAGFEFRNSGYEEITESGADSLDLTVSGDSYKRIAARFGVGINEDRKEYGWYISGEYKYLIDGNTPEIESSFEGTDVKFFSRGSEEGSGAIGIKAGGSLLVAENLKLFANANYYTGSKYNNIYGNIGVRWTFFGAATAAKIEEETRGERQLKAEKKAKKDAEKAVLKEIRAKEKSNEQINKETERILKDEEKAKREYEKKVKEEDKRIDAEIAAFEKARIKEKERLFREQQKEEKEKVRQIEEKIAADEEVKKRDEQKKELQTKNQILEYEMILAAEKMKEESKIKADADEKKAEEERKRKQAALVKQREADKKKALNGEISDEELAQRKKEAESRILKPVLKSFEVRFMTDEHALTGYWRIELKKQIEDIKKSDYKSIIIEGHADVSENDTKKLSRLRAKAVYDEFINGGIPVSKMQYIGLSAVMPTSKIDSDAGKMANRRVFVVVE